MEKVEGLVVSILFRNDTSGYSIIKIRPSVIPGEIIAVGSFHLIRKGLSASFYGNWKTHALYGKQFHIEHFTVDHPHTKEGLTSFLSSGIITGIGKEKAKNIVAKFGLLTLKILDKNPEKLLEVKGIGKKRLRSICEDWKRNSLLRDMATFLREYDLSLSLIKKIVQQFGSEAREKVMKNPFILADEIKGVGFFKADQIALKMGFDRNSNMRIRSGLLYILKKAAEEGHCCLPFDELEKKTVLLLSLPNESIELEITRCLQKRILIEENGYCYLPYLNSIENAVVCNLERRLQRQSKQLDAEETINEWISGSEEGSDRVYNDHQRKTIFALNNHRIVLLTGGPGTGKTTVLKLVVDLFESRKLKILMGAPTGRAAQKMSESTGKNARTIHRLLEYRPSGDNELLFGRNEENPLDADLIVIDETSMLDIILMFHLCRGIKEQTRILFVGDADQLPSIGPGNVLSGLISCGKIAHIQLQEIFRQAESSKIISAAHQINNGRIPVFENCSSSDLFFIEEKDPVRILDTITDLMIRRLPDRYKVDPLQHIQILSPMHKGILGTENINSSLQKLINKSDKKVVVGNSIYLCGDKVIQKRNNYENGIFNGEIGIITDITNEHSVQIDFNGISVLYSRDLLEQISLAYCISIHKSQGSEFDLVIIPMTMQHYIMLQRTLVYTALTRAKSLCVFVGEKRALNYSVTTLRRSVRYSLFGEKLKSLHHIGK